MKSITFAAAVACAAALTALAGCDKSRQTADGTTTEGATGSAQTASGAIASTGSPEQGGAGGTAPSAGTTINDVDRATPDSQAVGKANSAAEVNATNAAGARH